MVESHEHITVELQSEMAHKKVANTTLKML